MILSLIQNIRPDVPETDLAMVVAAPKPRLVKLAISPHGEEPFSLAGSPRKALRFVMKFELGGIAGVMAPLLGKQPKDVQIWILGGEMPTFVRRRPTLRRRSCLEHPIDQSSLAGRATFRSLDGDD